MIEREEYCVDILQQTAALRAAVDALSDPGPRGPRQGCVRSAAERGEADKYVDEVIDVVRRTLGRPLRGAAVLPDRARPRAGGTSGRHGATAGDAVGSRRARGYRRPTGRSPSLRPRRSAPQERCSNHAAAAVRTATAVGTPPASAAAASRRATRRLPPGGRPDGPRGADVPRPRARRRSRPTLPQRSGSRHCSRCSRRTAGRPPGGRPGRWRRAPSRASPSRRTRIRRPARRWPPGWTRPPSARAPGAPPRRPASVSVVTDRRRRRAAGSTARRSSAAVRPPPTGAVTYARVAGARARQDASSASSSTERPEPPGSRRACRPGIARHARRGAGARHRPARRRARRWRSLRARDAERDTVHLDRRPRAPDAADRTARVPRADPRRQGRRSGRRARIPAPRAEAIVGSMGELVGDLLELSRLESGTLEPGDRAVLRSPRPRAHVAAALLPIAIERGHPAS